MTHFPGPRTSHWLRCAHCIGKGRRFEYDMPCILLKDMPDGKRVKVQVFGDRFWKGTSYVSRIRYVSSDRVRPRDP